MTRRGAISVLLALSSVTLSGGADAKCGTVSYEVTVTVVERGSNKPVPGVELVFFEPGKESALMRRSLETPPARTDEAGVFRGGLRFNTYSGWGLLGDRCYGRLTRLEVIAIAPDRRAQRTLFRKLRGATTSQPYVFALEPVTVELYP